MLAGPVPLRAEHPDGDALERLLSALPVLQLPPRVGPAPGRRRDSKKRWTAILFASVFLHLLLAAILGGLMQIGRSPPPRKSIKAVFISSAVREGAQQPAAVDPAPPMPVEKTAAPQPIAKPAPSKPEKKLEKKASAAPSSAPVLKDQNGIEAEEDSDSLLNRLRANWLAPPRAAVVFRCRLRIDYRPGGMIAAVVVQQGCGDRLLADSIERAVWKTQPLKLEAGAPPSGSIELEFSP